MGGAREEVAPANGWSDVNIFALVSILLNFDLELFGFQTISRGD